MKIKSNLLTHQEIQKSSLYIDSEDLPETFSRPKEAKILQAYYASIADEDKDKIEIEMSGHSAKSVFQKTNRATQDKA